MYCVLSWQILSLNIRHWTLYKRNNMNTAYKKFILLLALLVHCLVSVLQVYKIIFDFYCFTFINQIFVFVSFQVRFMHIYEILGKRLLIFFTIVEVSRVARTLCWYAISITMFVFVLISKRYQQNFSSCGLTVDY